MVTLMNAKTQTLTRITGALLLSLAALSWTQDAWAQDREPTRAQAQETYELNYLGIMFAPDERRGTDLDRSKQFSTFRGKDKTPISGVEFYETLGRMDLAAKYRRHQALKLSLYGVGGAAFATGLVMWGMHLAGSPVSDDVNLRAIGFGAGVLGILSVGFTGLVNPHPIEAHDARDLADAHNAQLRRELGLGAGPRTRRDLTPPGGGLGLSFKIAY